MSRTKVTQIAMSNQWLKEQGLVFDQRTLVPFSLGASWMTENAGNAGAVSSTSFNRLVRTRMLGGVGRAGEIPALTRLTRLLKHTH